LQIGSGGAAGSINGTSNVVDNGTLAFDLSSSATFSKSVSGTGGLALMGSKLVVLTATDTYTGGTTVDGGTLDLAGTNNSYNGPSLPTTGIVNVDRPGTVNLTGLLAGYLLGVVGDDSSGEEAAAPADAQGEDSGAMTATLGGPPALSQGGAGSTVGGYAASYPSAPAGPEGVPEPGTLALLLCGAAALALAAWRRRRRGR
jgi:fibronectin-binding autotransporter adhesin